MTRRRCKTNSVWGRQSLEEAAPGITNPVGEAGESRDEAGEAWEQRAVAWRTSGRRGELLVASLALLIAAACLVDSGVANANQLVAITIPNPQGSSRHNGWITRATDGGRAAAHRIQSGRAVPWSSCSTAWARITPRMPKRE